MNNLARRYGLEDRSVVEDRKDAARVLTLELELAALRRRVEALEAVKARPPTISRGAGESSGSKPWEAAGVSKATWYRRRKGDV